MVRFHYLNVSNIPLGIYTFSIRARAEVKSGSFSNWVGANIISAESIAVSDEFALYRVKFEKTTNENSILTIRIYQSRTSTTSTEPAGVLWIDWYALVRGDKPMIDWTPAPEDQVTDWNESNVNSLSFLKNKPTTFTPSTHSHGSITNDGKIGTSADRIIETTTGGSLTHVAKNTAYNRAFGTGLNQVARGNHTHAYLPLTGGTLTGSSYNMLELKRSSTNGSSMLFSNSSVKLGKIGFTSNGNLVIGTGTTTDGVANMLSITPSGIAQFYGNISTSGLVTGTGFSKTGATDAHVLLGSGGHKSISDFNASLVTSTTTSGTANVATSNTNTYLNIVQGGASVGSSTRIVGSNGVTVASDTTGKLTITGLGAHAGVYSSRANGKGAASNSIEAKDTRSINPLPNTDLQRGVWFDFKSNSAIGLTGASTYSSVITMVPYGDNSGNSNASFRLAQSKNNLYFQN